MVETHYHSDGLARRVNEATSTIEGNFRELLQRDARRDVRRGVTITVPAAAPVTPPPERTLTPPAPPSPAPVAPAPAPLPPPPPAPVPTPAPKPTAQAVKPVRSSVSADVANSRSLLLQLLRPKK